MISMKNASRNFAYLVLSLKYFEEFLGQVNHQA